MGTYSIYRGDVPIFQLDHFSKKKIECPDCGKKTFVPFINVTTGEQVMAADGKPFGICDRASKCNCKRIPTARDIKGNMPLMIPSSKVKKEFVSNIDPDIISVIPNNDVIKYQKFYNSNKLYKFLVKTFGELPTLKAFTQYKVGTINWGWKGCTVFWQVDQNYAVRTGKIMEYDVRTGHRVKEVIKEDGEETKIPHMGWYHSQYQDYALVQCLFGEHLLNEFPENATINIAEAEKTAIICSINKPNALWMAVGGLQNIRERLFTPLKDRKIILYPDKGSAYDKWCEKAKRELFDYDVKVSDFLEKTDELKEGDDIADLIIMKQQNKK